MGLRVSPVLRLTRPITHEDPTMNTRQTSSLTIALIALSLGACSGMSTRDKNTAAGAAIGGVAGAVLTGGSTAGTVGGAAVGGVIGNKVDPKKH
jgi:osmotically inducible lipoprotein OsmB